MRMPRKLKRLWYRLLRKTPLDFPMVSYWKTKEAVMAKLQDVDGAQVMFLEGEKYPLSCFPRGHLLVPRGEQFGPFSVLKHQCKQVFNRAWDLLEQKYSAAHVAATMRVELKALRQYMAPLQYDTMPPSSMAKPVREIYRAWTQADSSEASLVLRDILCLILQEDDSYRYRVQWLALWFPWFSWSDPVKLLDKGLWCVEQAEVIGDMKRKLKLLRRVLSVLLQDPRMREDFVRFFKACDWRKVRITEAERYHFRSKYFKCDWDVLEY